MSDIAQAIISLRPNAKWSVDGGAYAGITWLDTDQTKPTEAEITAEVARLKAEYERTEYQRKRAAEYPSIADQLDTLYHGGYEAWKATVQAVKAKYPKEQA